MNNKPSWFRGLRGKLLLSALLPVLAFVLITGIAVTSLNSLGTLLTSAYSETIPTLDSLGGMGMQRARIGYFIWASLANKEDQKSRHNFIAKAKDAFAEFKKSQDYYESTPPLPEEVKLYAKSKEGKARFRELTEQLISSLEKNTAENDQVVYKSMNGGEWHMLATDLQGSVAGIMKLYHDKAEVDNKAQIAERTQKIQLLILVASLCGFALFGILMWIAYRVSNAVSSIASGLAESGGEVSSAIVQLSAAGQTLSQASTEAAASLEETVASLEEMSSMVKMNADNAKQAAALSISSRESAEQGQNEISTLIESMQEISKSSKQIEEIISVIDDIAFQTNLLALNASVEAARAGEHGKGFAVVAEAVRALAQRSAVAAKDINGLIKDSVDKVERGSSIADRSGEVLANIVNSVKKVSDLNNEISAASMEQSTGIEQINKAMNQLDQGSQANAASSEEVAASAEEINAQTNNMKKMIESLNALILGEVSSSSPGPEVTSRKEGRSPQKKETKVLAFKSPAKASAPKFSSPAPAPKPSHSASNVIPFDEDVEEGPRSKVGTTDGF